MVVTKGEQLAKTDINMVDACLMQLERGKAYEKIT